MPTELASHLRDVLIAGRNPDGGWGYYAGKASRLEPTGWALLSLLEDRHPDDTAIVEAGLHLLAKWQRADGLIAEPPLPPNLAFNGLTSLVFTAVRTSAFAESADDQVQRRLLAGIIGVRSETLWNWNSPVRQDNSLVGWPWSEDAFGWIDPTAWCALALKKTAVRERPPGGQERLEQAERLLLDRQCAGGGWNYGNSEVPGAAASCLRLLDRARAARAARSPHPAGGATICRVPAPPVASRARGDGTRALAPLLSNLRPADGGRRNGPGSGVAKERVPWKPRSSRHGAARVDGWDAWTTRPWALNGDAATSWRCRSWRPLPRVVHASTVPALRSRHDPLWVCSPRPTTGRTSRT